MVPQGMKGGGLDSMSYTLQWHVGYVACFTLYLSTAPENYYSGDLILLDDFRWMDWMEILRMSSSL
jgi:hypothetical protein